MHLDVRETAKVGLIGEGNQKRTLAQHCNVPAKPFQGPG